MLVYGLLITALCLGSFALVVYGFGGNLGANCNAAYSAACDTVFRARATTTFACLAWFREWEMVDRRRSFFSHRAPVDQVHTLRSGRPAHDIRRNQFLFWTVLVGVVMLFLTLHIPVLNKVVFKHMGISWEWGIVFLSAALFFAGVEAWKWAKRVYFGRVAARRRGANGEGEGLDVEDRIFADYLA